MNKYFYSLTPATPTVQHTFTVGQVEIALKLPPRPIYYSNLKKLCDVYGLNYDNAYYALKRLNQDTYEVGGMTIGKHTMC